MWECELEKSRLEDTVFRIAQEIRENGELFNQRKEERRVERERWRIEQASKRKLFGHNNDMTLPQLAE